MELMRAFDSNEERHRVVGKADDCVEMIEGLEKDRPVFGIDLGTTNSAISVITKGDKPETIVLTNGRSTMPSCVMWKDGKFIIGEEAYRHREMSNVIYSVKRYMQDPGKTVTFQDGDKSLTMTPAEVSAKILEGLVEQTGGVYGEIQDVVITVPAYFDQNGRNATRKAAELAGLNLIDIINEPTAAALCYDVKGDGGDTTDFLTFDFGGGTFDITLARITGGNDEKELDDIYGMETSESKKKIIQCLAIEGDSHLGGDDVDRDLFKIVGKKIEEVTGVSVSELSREYQESLILRLERLKKMGTEGLYEVGVDTTSVNGKKVQCSVLVERDDFLASLIPSYKKCKKITDKLLKRTENVAKTIILVGGSTKNPLLVQLLKEDYPDFIISNAVNQDLAVTLGAAVKGKIDKFGSEAVSIFDILPISIGIDDEDKMTPLIKAGTVLPATAVHNFTNCVDNQERMRLRIIQGSSKFAEECVCLGELLFDGLPHAREGELQLSVSLTVNANSQLVCTGCINGMSKELKLSLTGESEEKKSNCDDKLKRRWARFANTLSGSEKEQFESLVAGYPEYCSRKDVSHFIKQHTEKLKEK